MNTAATSSRATSPRRSRRATYPWQSMLLTICRRRTSPANEALATISRKDHSMTAPRLALATFFLLAAALSQASAQEPVVVPLWPKGAPGFEARKDEPENVKKKGKLEQSVTNVNNPSLTVYLPAKENASGAGIIICPGGGHSVLAIEHEGHNVGQWLADNGI